MSSLDVGGSKYQAEVERSRTGHCLKFSVTSRKADMAGTDGGESDRDNIRDVKGRG